MSNDMIAARADDARLLLKEALDLFNDQPRLSLRRDRSRTSYALAARIEAYLGTAAAAHPAISIARDQWATSGFLRVDSDERQYVQQDGNYWVRAWVRVDANSAGDVDPEVADRYRVAVAALPKLTRSILVAHQQNEESIAAIADRLGLTTADVERHIGEALAAITFRLDRA